MPRKIKESEPTQGQMEDPKIPQEVVIFMDFIHRTADSIQEILIPKDEVSKKPRKNRIKREKHSP